MDFELLAWGSAFESSFDQRQMLARWNGKPDVAQVQKEIDWFLSRFKFDEIRQQFDGNNSHYDVIKDGKWKTVYFMLLEN